MSVADLGIDRYVQVVGTMASVPVNPSYQRYFELLAIEFENNRLVKNAHPVLMARECFSHVLGAEIFSMSSDICEMIARSSLDLPPEVLYEDDPFCDNGFIVLQKPYVITDLLPSSKELDRALGMTRYEAIEKYEKSDKTAFVDLICWKVAPVRSYDRDGKVITHKGVLYEEYHQGGSVPMDFQAWQFGKPWDISHENTVPIEGEPFHKIHVTNAIGRRWLLAFWRLVKQRIITPAVTAPSRGARRRAAKSLKEIKPVSVVTLRAMQRKASSESSQVDWSHRWTVRGHWRDQWYPSKDRHEKIWIHPFIKGPEDKPLVVKEKIFQVVR